MRNALLLRVERSCTCTVCARCSGAGPGGSSNCRVFSVLFISRGAAGGGLAYLCEGLSGCGISHIPCSTPCDAEEMPSVLQLALAAKAGKAVGHVWVSLSTRMTDALRGCSSAAPATGGFRVGMNLSCNEGSACIRSAFRLPFGPCQGNAL